MCSLPLGNKNPSIFNVIFFLCSILHVMYGLYILNYYCIQHFELLFYIAFYIFYIMLFIFCSWSGICYFCILFFLCSILHDMYGLSISYTFFILNIATISFSVWLKLINKKNFINKYLFNKRTFNWFQIFPIAVKFEKFDEMKDENRVTME